MEITKENKFVETPFGKHHIQIISPPQPVQKINLVFLHDALGSIFQWKNFPKELVFATNIRGIVIERIGHGRSDSVLKKRGSNYLHREALDILPVILESLNIVNPLLIGHSDGATIALIYASKFNPLGLVLFAAHTFVENQTRQGISSLEKNQDLVIPKLATYHGDKGEKLFHDWKTIWQSQLFRTWNIFAELATIHCQILAIQGDEDQYGTIEQIETIQQKSSSSFFEKLLIPNVGHSPHLESMQICIDAIVLFLASSNGRS